MTLFTARGWRQLGAGLLCFSAVAAAQTAVAQPTTTIRWDPRFGKGAPNSI